MPATRARIRAVRRHRVPTWWRDAKLGIFVHWTPASVPAFAPTESDMGNLLARGDPHALAWSPYVEWYENSLQFSESPVARFHAATYPGTDYRSFATRFNEGLEDWDPESWAAAFAATGARYVVLVSKHADGFCLWPSAVTNPQQPSFHASRDIVGELGEAVRAQHMRFGLYYSGGLDTTFNDHPIGTFSDLLAAQPRGDYPAYAEAQVRELIARYRPSILWNDISWPAPLPQLARLLGDYYDAVPDGVVNDRFMPWSPLWRVATTAPGRRLLDRVVARQAAADKGIIPPKPPLYDVRTPEYTVFDTIQPDPWECVRGMDHSFGFNQMSTEEHFITERDLLWSLVDIAAKGGNLLLNVGPRGVDAQIPELQQRRLEWLAGFTAHSGQALMGTRPWVRPGADRDGTDIRYTAHDRTVYAFIRQARGNTEIVLPEVDASARSTVTTLDGRVLPSEATTNGLRVHLLAALDGGRPTVIALHDVSARPKDRPRP